MNDKKRHRFWSFIKKELQYRRNELLKIKMRQEEEKTFWNNYIKGNKGQVKHINSSSEQDFNKRIQLLTNNAWKLISDVKHESKKVYWAEELSGGSYIEHNYSVFMQKI